MPIQHGAAKKRRTRRSPEAKQRTGYSLFIRLRLYTEIQRLCQKIHEGGKIADLKRIHKIKIGLNTRKERLEDWLGGLDSNQDSQIQNLKSCQLDDLPTGLRNETTKTNRSTFPDPGQPRFTLFRVNGFAQAVNQRALLLVLLFSLLWLQEPPCRRLP